MITLPTEINKVSGLVFEMDLGFKVQQFEAGYRKRFHNTRYHKYNITLQLDESRGEISIWNTFFNETIEQGILKFEMTLDLIEPTAIVEMTTSPTYELIESNVYSVSFEAIIEDTSPTGEMFGILSCLDGFVNSLDGVNNLIENNISASREQMDVALCLTNFENLFLGDVNEYKVLNILPELVTER